MVSYFLLNIKGKVAQVDSLHKNEGRPSEIINKQINSNEDRSNKKENNLDANYINMDDIFHLDSIPGLANILADDSIDPSFAENSDQSVGSVNQNLHKPIINNDLKDGGSKFSQFFQQDSRLDADLNQNLSTQVPRSIERSDDQEEIGFQGIFEHKIVGHK